MSKVLLIDNFDSFTYNLVDEFAKRDCELLVYRNNTPIGLIEGIVRDEFRPDLLVISPGPSSPKDAGISIPLIERYYTQIPIFGVCLGHQAIIEALGGVVGKAPHVVHGKSAMIQHDGKTIYSGVENPLHAGRYHSLVGTKIPNSLDITADHDGVVMGVRHKEYLVEGVQFHPESILTALGGKLIENLLNMVKERR